MTIGVRAHDYGKQPVERLLGAIASDGWQTVQLAFPKAVAGVGSFAEVTPQVVEAAKSALAANQLTIAVLGVYVEPSLTDEKRRRQQAETLLHALPQAKALAAGCVATETTAMKKQPGVTRAEALKVLRRTLEEVLPEAQRLGVTIAVEPVHYHALNTPELAAALLKDMASPMLKLVFDPVNLLRPEDITAQDALWGRCSETFGENIAAVHIKGASQEADADGILKFASLESSVVDYQALFSRLRHIDAPILREQAVPENAAAEIAFLRRRMRGEK